jgi:aspartyl-tRNA(Asn)/glutamyl-tRNA(Gln) amidotransferase subunit C
MILANFTGESVKMILNDEMVKKLADLARLEFSPEEEQAIKEDLQQIIGFVEKLNEIDTTGISPLTHISDTINSLRDDEVKGSVSTSSALSNAPDAIDPFFSVPKVIKK